MALTTKPSDYPGDVRAGPNGVSHNPVVSQKWEVPFTS